MLTTTRSKTRARLTEPRKSELCLQCGKCCIEMTFYGGVADNDSRDEIRWLELHGLRIDYVKKRRVTEYYYTIPRRCSELEERITAAGEVQYACGIYATRPQICRDYDGSISGPLGVTDCLWRQEREGKAIPPPKLVTLSRTRR